MADVKNNVHIGVCVCVCDTSVLNALICAVWCSFNSQLNFQAHFVSHDVTTSARCRLLCIQWGADGFQTRGWVR